ncbi:MAG: zinc-ribbon domain-containing protein, partial [Armatimonadetes bacterium]|nr:zinc-ribbon domain-containing protein [Armatimonadota bacterium]
LDISGLVDRSEEPRELGTLLPADVLVVGRVTMFQSKKQTVAGGLLDSPVLGGLHREKGIVKMLLKVVDVRTGRVLGISEATGEATEAVIAGGYAGILFGGAQFDRTAMGRATRKAIDQAVRMIASCLERAGVAVRTCPNCSAAVPREARFCTQCGKRLKSTQQAATCPKCGERLPAGAKFCPECGSKVR